MSPENSRGRQAIDISAAFTALACIVVALRLYARFFLVRCAGLEDYGIILAMVGTPADLTYHKLIYFQICSIGLTIAIGFRG
jgi:hypothetical protein